MAFFMEFLRQKIIDNMQSHEEIDKFWHDRINHNKEVAKKWLEQRNQPFKTYGVWKSEQANAKYKTNLDPGVQQLNGRRKAIDE